MFSSLTSNKIPGELPLKCDHYIQDLKKLHPMQLVEIKAREEKLMSRINNLNRLPDKGQRIKDFYQKVCQELERRYDVDEAAERFSEMNIASTGQKKLINMEWNGNLNSDPIADVIDSDDEAEMNPLKVIAQRRMHEKKVRIVPQDKSLVTQQDIEEIKTFGNEKSESATNMFNNYVDKEEDPHLQYLVEKGVDLPPTKEKFKPYQTTISNVHDPEKEKLRKKGKYWENTAATPPIIQHGATKMLTLTDSVEIQKAYLFKLKDLQEKQAADRLAVKLQRAGNLKIEVPSETERKDNPMFSTYRDVNAPQVRIEGTQHIDEDDEVEDLDDEKPGGVVYTVFE